MNGDMNRFTPATPGAYIFPRNSSHEVITSIQLPLASVQLVY